MSSNEVSGNNEENDRGKRLDKANFDYLSGCFQYNHQRTMTMLVNLIDSLPGVPIISVGIGNGYLEAHIKKIYPNRIIFGVDPDPREFNKIPDEFYKKKCVKPITSTLETGKLDKYIGNNILIINWPDPNQSDLYNEMFCHKTHGDGKYDINALLRMKPKGFFINHAPCGTSGTDELIEFFGEKENPKCFYDFHLPTTSLEVSGKEYKLISCHTANVKFARDSTTIVFRCFSYSQEFTVASEITEEAMIDHIH